jgi:ribosomal protein S18 acetylase RimI-like enzyme
VLAVSDVLDLDNVVWGALTNDHERFAERVDGAARYQPDVSIFGAVETLDDSGWTAIGDLVGPGGFTVLFRPGDIVAPAPFAEVFRDSCFQMIAPAQLDADAAASVVDLDTTHQAAMAELLELGELPWRPRTSELGRYVGVMGADGGLDAVAGERFAPPGGREISAVATNPAVRRNGLGAMVTTAVALNIRAEGRVPFLHVTVSNEAAVALYERLGFVTHQTVHVVGVQRSE